MGAIRQVPQRAPGPHPAHSAEVDDLIARQGAAPLPLLRIEQVHRARSDGEPADRRLSMSPVRAARVRAALRRQRHADLKALAEGALRCKSREQVTRLVRKTLAVEQPAGAAPA